ncbi:hypothetical protein [Siminovitchia sp. 179-K 8D1 HS]|uniref:hypothetical protein n=1 Tax=Siminovitchia sp. 179-K 8D1 HS TaxID=3142385 RepID=UPI0039A2BA97
MNKYIALILQLMIWSGFTLAEWLSGGDRLFFKVILFGVFFYLAFMLGRIIVKSNKITFVITAMSLSAYLALHLLLQFIFPA